MHHSSFNYHQSVDDPRQNHLNLNQNFNLNSQRILVPQQQEQIIENVPSSSSFDGPNYSQNFFLSVASPFPPIPFMAPTHFSHGNNYSVPPPSHVFNESSVAAQENKDTCEHLVESKSILKWLQLKKIQLNVEPKKIKQKFQIRSYREKLEACAFHMKKLDNLFKKTKDDLENMNEETWNGLSNKMLVLKKKIEKDLESLTDKDIISLIKAQLQKRKSKRERLKRRKIEMREEKIKQEHIRKIQNQQIDDWLRSQLEKGDKIKRDDRLKKEAESVLSEVTRRTAEANRQIELLSGLLSLRTIKAQSHSKEKKSAPLKDGSFIVFENLQKMWEKKLKEYELEEQGLRLMLSEANEETIKSNQSFEKQALTKWKHLLFGEVTSHQFYEDINELILIRNQWDQFIIPNSDTNIIETSSFIPNGWVLPSAPSSDEWSKLIKKN